MQNLRTLRKGITEPLIVLICILLYGCCLYIHVITLGFFFIALAIVIGSYRLFVDTYYALRKKQFSLDYIPFFSLILAFSIHDYLTCSVIALIISTTHNSMRLLKIEENKADSLIHLTRRYSGYFTLITLVLSVFSYLFSGNSMNVLAVLAIATPYPLLLAPPLALQGNISLIEKQRMAVQSIRWGIGLSFLGMFLAIFGLIPPLLGAILQAIINMSVIFNALRTTR